MTYKNHRGKVDLILWHRHSSVSLEKCSFTNWLKSTSTSLATDSKGIKLYLRKRASPPEKGYTEAAIIHLNINEENPGLKGGQNLQGKEWKWSAGT